jgi:hypothetical protein
VLIPSVSLVSCLWLLLDQGLAGERFPSGLARNSGRREGLQNPSLTHGPISLERDPSGGLVGGVAEDAGRPS